MDQMENDMWKHWLGALSETQEKALLIQLENKFVDKILELLLVSQNLWSDNISADVIKTLRKKDKYESVNRLMDKLTSICDLDKNGDIT